MFKRAPGHKTLKKRVKFQAGIKTMLPVVFISNEGIIRTLGNYHSRWEG